MRLFAAIGGLAGMLMGGSALAQGADVLWTPSPRSMSDYITEGWKILSHKHEQYSNGDDHQFVLQQGNKAVICFVWIQPRKDVTSSCRLLN